MSNRDMCLVCLRADIRGSGVIHPDFPLCGSFGDDGLLHTWPSEAELAQC